MKRCKLLSINVDSISDEEVYDYIISLSNKEEASHVILLDTYLLMRAKFDKELASIINNADLVIPISRGLQFGLNFFKTKLAGIYNSFKFTIRLCTKITDSRKNLYVVGGQNQKDSEKAEKNIRESFPGIKLMGKYHASYKKDFEKKLLLAIYKVSPSFVLVSGRRPRQEKWIYRHKQKFNNCVFIGVGNFVHVLAGKEKYQKYIDMGKYDFEKLSGRPFKGFLYFCYFFALIFSRLFIKNNSGESKEELWKDETYL